MIEQLVIEPAELLEIGEDKTETIVIHEAVEIVEVGVLGPPGRPGRDGADGANAEGALTWATETFPVNEDDTREFTIAFEPKAGSVLFYLNGLREPQFSSASNVVTVDSGVPVLAGDTITINYQREL